MRLLRGALAEPRRPVAALDLLGPEERGRLLAAHEVLPLVHQGLAARFHALAARQPEVIAADDGSRRLTYGELAARSRQLAGPAARARRRARRGGGDGRRTFARGGARPVGGAHRRRLFVPLHTSLPAARRQFVLRDLACAALFADPATAESGETGPPLLALGDLLEAGPAGPPPLPVPRSEPTELAAAIYTAGLDRHAQGGRRPARRGRSLAHRLRRPAADRPRHPLRPGPPARISTSRSPRFSGTLGRGGTLVIAADAAAGGFAPYAAWLADQRVAIAQIPVPHLAELLKTLVRRRRRRSGTNFSAVRPGRR